MTAPITFEKRGLIFRPDSSLPWSRSHAAVPTPFQLEGSRYRVYFASRDESRRSHVGWFDLDLERPDAVLESSPMPVLTPGPMGHFDSEGIYAECVVRHEGGVRMYTAGITTGHTEPLFSAGIALATSKDHGRTFTKYSTVPIMGRSEHDPCLATAPFVLWDEGRWRMWYASGIRWTLQPQGWQSYYHIKYAESDDGVSWRREGRVCIDFAGPHEKNIARLWVVKDDGRYRGWFSVNDGVAGYRIAYAESADGLSWTRHDDRAGITLSETGWDSQAQAYPAVVRHGGRWFMFYNGNAFGREGIGLAIAPA